MDGSREPASARESKGVATNGVALYSGGRKRDASSLVGGGDGVMAESRKRPSGLMNRMLTENAEREKNARLREQEALEAETREKDFLTGALVFECYLFTLLDPEHPGEEVSWTETQKAQLRTSNQVNYDKAISYEVKSGTSCAQQLRTLDSGQQALVQRLLAYKNADEGNPELEWTLFSVRSLNLYERPGSVFKAYKFNHAVRIIVKRGDRIILAEDTADKSPDKKVLSEGMSNHLAAQAHERKDSDSKGKKSVAATEPPAEPPASSPNDTSENSRAPVYYPRGPELLHPQSVDYFDVSHGMPSKSLALRPSAIPPVLHPQSDSSFDGGLEETIPDLHERRQHGISRLQQRAPDIQEGSQDVKPKSGVHERRKIMNAFLARESGKQPGSRDNNTLIPRRKPRRSISDLEMSVENTRGHEQTIPAGDGRPESFRAHLRDADTEASGPYDGKTTSAGEAQITEGDDMSEVRTSPNQDVQEASPSGEPRSTQIETAPLSPQVPSPLLTWEQRTAPILMPEGLFGLALDQPTARGWRAFLPTWSPYETAGLLPEKRRKQTRDPKLRATAKDTLINDWPDYAFRSMDSWSSTPSTRQDFWSNPDTCGDRPYRRETLDIPPECDYLRWPSNHDQFPYIYEERGGGRGNRPNVLLQGDPQRSVRTPDNPVEDSSEVEQTGRSDLPQRSRSLDEITKSLFCTRELLPIFTAAWKDADIGAERLEQNARRLIQLLGKELESETADKRELDLARAFIITGVSSYIARSILQHVKATFSRLGSMGSLQIDPSDAYGISNVDWKTLDSTLGSLKPPLTTCRTFEKEVVWMNRSKYLSLEEMNTTALLENEMLLQSAKRVSLLTFLAMIFVPLSFLLSFLGMNLQEMSEMPHRHWWFIVLFVMTAVCMLIAFRWSIMSHGQGGAQIQPISTSNSTTNALLYNNEAFDNFRAGLIDYVHEPYEKRMLLAIGDEVEQSGGHLEQDNIRCMAREISWVPSQHFTYPSDIDLSCADAAKAFVEDRLGESWNWWPLAPRIHRLRSGYCRVQWKSVCAQHHIYLARSD
jgi:hypothetical protein